MDNFTNLSAKLPLKLKPGVILPETSKPVRFVFNRPHHEDPARRLFESFKKILKNETNGKNIHKPDLSERIIVAMMKEAFLKSANRVYFEDFDVILFGTEPFGHKEVEWDISHRSPIFLKSPNSALSFSYVDEMGVQSIRQMRVLEIFDDYFIATHPVYGTRSFRYDRVGFGWSDYVPESFNPGFSEISFSFKKPALAKKNQGNLLLEFKEMHLFKEPASSLDNSVSL